MRPENDAPASRMLSEALEGPAACARLLERGAPLLDTIAADLRSYPPRLVVMCARGSSDHAAVYGRYLLETRLGVPVSHAAPSAITLGDHVGRRGAEDVLCIAISQSGRSPDLLATAGEWKAAGAQVLALVNDEASPLAALADHVLPLCAGPEVSVAATKSYLCSLAALAMLTAALTGDAELQSALPALPDALQAACRLDWSPAVEALAQARNLFTIGRGATLGLGREAALKMKETCQLHAEAFSSAEVRHGPMAIVGEGFPVLAFADTGPTGEDVQATAQALAAVGARVLIAGAAAPGALALPTAAAPHPALDTLVMAQAFYPMVEALSRRRGLDVDRPAHLSKVTCTL